MVNALFKGLFILITKLYNFIIFPFISIVLNLFPNLNTYFNYITSFLTTAFTYVRSVLSLLLISDTMILAIFDYFIVLYSIYTVVLSIRFIIKIYNKFKI